jgi:hypothetical protein
MYIIKNFSVLLEPVLVLIRVGFGISLPLQSQQGEDGASEQPEDHCVW